MRLIVMHIIKSHYPDQGVNIYAQYSLKISITLSLRMNSAPLDSSGVLTPTSDKMMQESPEDTDACSTSLLGEAIHTI